MLPRPPPGNRSDAGTDGTTVRARTSVSCRHILTYITKFCMVYHQLTHSTMPPIVSPGRNFLFQRFFDYLETRGRRFNFVVGVVCLSLVCLVDWLGSDILSFNFFYMFPIVFTTWYSGRRPGQLIAILAAISWTYDNHVHESHALVWNILSTIGAFLVIATLVGKVREMWENERTQSRRDPLTGLVNSRAFMEILAYEVARFKRGGVPFSLGYIDLDEFKEVNDRYGHQRGDELLRQVADLFRDNLRKTDVIARMGGDEFAILFPGTSSDASRLVMQKVRGLFLATMKENNWPTTFSMGIVTCDVPPETADEILLLADRLMYQAKGSGKNRLEFSVYSDEDQSYPVMTE